MQKQKLMKKKKKEKCNFKIYLNILKNITVDNFLVL